MDIGLEQLEQKGYKEVKVEEIAKATGIAKGTFYHFFPSKEQFFYEIIIRIRDYNRTEIYNLFAEGKQPSYQELLDYFTKRYIVNKTVYHYFSMEELNVIFRKLTDKADLTKTESNDFAAEVFSQLKKGKNDYQIEVVVNMMNVMASFSANRKLIANDYYDETIQLMAKALTDYIFGK